jgi:hypothetical protein
MKNITNRNNKGQRHGYQEWYWNDGDLWYRGSYKNGRLIRYEEYHGINITKYNIR